MFVLRLWNVDFASTYDKLYQHNYIYIQYKYNINYYNIIYL